MSKFYEVRVICLYYYLRKNFKLFRPPDPKAHALFEHSRFYRHERERKAEDHPGRFSRGLADDLPLHSRIQGSELFSQFLHALKFDSKLVRHLEAPCT